MHSVDCNTFTNVYLHTSLQCTIPILTIYVQLTIETQLCLRRKNIEQISNDVILCIEVHNIIEVLIHVSMVRLIYRYHFGEYLADPKS